MFFRFACAYKFRYVYQMAFASGLLWSIFVMKSLNYNVIHYLERKRTKGTLFIFHACSDKLKKYVGFMQKRGVSRPYLIVGHGRVPRCLLPPNTGQFVGHTHLLGGRVSISLSVRWSPLQWWSCSGKKRSTRSWWVVSSPWVAVCRDDI